VVLLSLDWRRAKDPRTSLAHASLRARLEQVPDLEVVSIRRAVNAPGFSRDEVLAAVRAELAVKATELAVGVYVWNEHCVRWLLDALRAQGFSGRIILGGPQISYAPAGVAARYPAADLLIRGYGEDALAAVLTGRPPRSIPGVLRPVAPDSGLPAAVDLGALPSPILSGVLPVTPFMRWETQRGCIYRCAFCQHREPGARLRRRALPLERVLAEVGALVEGGAQDIAVLDPIFNSGPHAADILGAFTARGYRGRLSLQARFELLDDAFLDACAGLDCVLEFGLQTVQPDEMAAIGRINKLDRVEAAIAALHRRGQPFEVSLIYGLPNQTLDSFRATVAWCRERGVPVIRAFPLMLLRGTELSRQRRRWGLVQSDDPVPVVVESHSFRRQDWQQMAALAAELNEQQLLRGAA